MTEPYSKSVLHKMEYIYLCFVIHLFCICQIPTPVQGDLRDSLHTYDTLHSRDINHHHVNRRSINGGKTINERVVSFDTLGRHFLLHLKTNEGLFSPDFEAVEVGDDESHIISLDLDDFYQGYLDDDHGSRVLAYYEQDNLVVNIRTKTDSYFVEPSWRHLPASPDYTMIAYRASDVVKTKNLGSSFCGVHDNQLNATRIPLEEVSDGYTYSSNHGFKGRYKRQSSIKPSCEVALVADYTFFQGIGEGNSATTSKYLSGIAAFVNDIYENTNFGSGYTGMGFAIKLIQVHSSASNNPQYNRQQASWATEALLKTFGTEDWSSYCLAHLFTYRAFAGGVQGLGWVASGNINELGGICSQAYRGSNYNTAWTTHQATNGERILSSEANLVTAHEFGHNWGSSHDPTACAPDAKDGGKYVMYQYSVAGYDSNNDRFSSCSISSIKNVLQAKSSRCFTDKSTSYCGNGNVEPGEECDAGYDGLAGTDPCCSSSCTFKGDSVCSDMNSPCCENCQYSSQGGVCRAATLNTCDAEGICDGIGAECPDSLPKVDGDSCLDNGQCRNGVCKSFCEYNYPGKVNCYCETENDACTYCCRDSGAFVCTVPSIRQAMTEGHNCFGGYCNGGVCETVAPNTVRLWDVIKAGDFNAILEWMRDNIVVTVIVLSLILYLPFCIAVWCIDRRRKKQDKDEVDWHSRDNNRLTMDGDNRRVHRGERRRHQPSRNGDYSRLEEEEEPSEASPY